MFTALIEKLVRHEDLTAEGASAAMQQVMDGRAARGARRAAVGAGDERGAAGGDRRLRPDDAGECGEAVERRRARCSIRAGPAAIDRAPSTSLRRRRWSWRRAACKVAKHGNRSVSSRCGSADVFEQLGVNVAAAPAVVERTLRDANIAFFFAPTFHPSMKHAAPTRRELGIRTAFNLLGPLTNPAGATRQIVGVPRSELTELLARALMLLGSDARVGRSWRRRHRRNLDDGLHQGVRVPGRRRAHLLRPSSRFRIRQGGASRPERRRCGRKRCDRARRARRPAWRAA